jgi:hypothetical protein
VTGTNRSPRCGMRLPSVNSGLPPGCSALLTAVIAGLQLGTRYRDLMGKIGAKSVLVRDDGSMEFTIWGFGCTICSDSFMGIRYSPMNHTKQGRAGWVPTLVSSLDSRNLPQENGSVATGLYVVRLEPEWFIYRLEYLLPSVTFRTLL